MNKEGQATTGPREGPPATITAMTRIALALMMTTGLALWRPVSAAVDQAADAPGRRIGHSLVYDANAGVVVLLDGYSWIRAVSPTEPPAHTDLWRWNGSAWTRVPHQPGPAARTMGRAVYDLDRARIVSYGGRVGRTETPSSETWEFDGATWHRLADVSVGPNVHIEMAYDAARRQVIRFGGAIRPSAGGDLHWSTDTWAWAGATWTRVSADGPPGRAAANMVYDSRRGEIVLFGGQGAAPAPGQPQPVFGDTWTWNGTTWRLASREGPPARAYHAMAFDERAGVVLIHGGNQGETTLGDMWAWDGTRWTEIRVSGATPGARRLHAMAHDSRRARTVLYGGAGPRPGGGTDVHSDTWEFDGTAWAKRSDN
jgi:hypothetical protein